MKKKYIWIIGTITIALLVSFIVISLNFRKPTSVEITSVTPSKSILGDTVRVEFRVLGGSNDFSIVVLPDTQHYSEDYPESFLAQTQWIAENIKTKNIIFVSHLGDIVQNNDYFEEEWKVADLAMGELDGKIPYGVLPGNHDMQFGGQAQLYQRYFPESRFRKYSWWGGSFNENKNNFQLITQAGEEFIILHLQYCPPNSAIDWANEVLSNYSERKAILSTHSYLRADGSRVGHCQEKSDGGNSGFDIWKKVIRQNTNIFLTLSGHIPGVARREDQVDGRVVYQLLSDYQDFENGGDGYLRILTFQPNQDKILVTTYSPVLNAYLKDLENEFDLSFDLNGGRLPKGFVTISKGMDSCRVAVETGFCELQIKGDESLNFSAKYSGDFYFEGSKTE